METAHDTPPPDHAAEQYLRKGSKVYLEGQLETRKWQDQSGADRYSTEVVLRPFNGSLTLLDQKRDDGGYDDRQSDKARTADKAQRPDGYGGGGKPYDDDYGDAIPFSPEWR